MGGNKRVGVEGRWVGLVVSWVVEGDRTVKGVVGCVSQ